MNSVRVLVLGDLARSPRILNHALSFSHFGWDVYLSGYLNNKLPESIIQNPSINVTPVIETSQFINKMKYMKFFLIFKVILTALYLFLHLLRCEWTHIIFIQNPPALPTFYVAWIICKIRRMKVMVDWHNLGYTLVPGSEDESKNILRKFYRKLEISFSRKRLRPINFTVSKALKNELLLKWNIQSDVLYDLPWKISSERNVEKFHNLYQRLKSEYPELKGKDDNSTVFTTVDENGLVKWDENRPAILASGCSWTTDDDFEVLFQVFNEYDKLSEDVTLKLPNIFCIITGKGPLKKYYQDKIKSHQWKHVIVLMPWLEDVLDYPVLLESADLGISLHRSSSGLDLPMKIVDMFSVCLPVLALNYKCLHELVVDRHNGRLFTGEEGLLRHLTELLPGAPAHQSHDLNLYRNNIRLNVKSRHSDNEYIAQQSVPPAPPRTTWLDEWQHVVLPVATNLVIDNYNKAKSY